MSPSSVIPSGPISPVASVVLLDNTIGAILIATFIALALYGLVVHQYFQLCPKDSTWIKALVVFTLVFETVHVVLSTYTCHYYLVTNYDHREAALSSVWSLGSLGMVTTLVGISSQIFFARRIFCLGGQKYQVLVVLISSVSCVDFGFTVLLICEQSSHTSGTVWFLISTAYLKALIYPNNMIYVGFGIVAAKLYANSLLAALNTRSALRYGLNPVVNMSTAGSNALLVPRQETTGPSEVNQIEAACPVVTSRKAEATSQDRQAFLTLELVGIAI
ncbi:hypothetical protein V8D89_001688 [Ganoderma adspersum]